MSPLYFAYGSNMASADGFLGAARLDDYRLELRRRSVRWGAGVLDLVPSPGDAVWGALYELPEEALIRLDRREGAGFAYRRIDVEPLLDGERRPAIAYEVIDKEPREVPCAPEYAALVVGGARDRGLPPEWVRALETRLGTARAGKSDG